MRTSLPRPPRRDDRVARSALGAATTRTTPAEEQNIIERHLRGNANRYCPQPSGQPTVALLEHSQRATARLYWYRIHGPAAERVVIVKVPGATAGDAPRPPDRPRLVEAPRLDLKYTFEHRALQLLERHFGFAGDERFGAIPLLDRIDAARALVMGRVEGRSLNGQMARLGRLGMGRSSPDTRRAIENAGAWLRSFHQLHLPDAGNRQAQRDDLARMANRYCAHLGSTLSRPAWFAALRDALETAIARTFPAQLPLARTHGDFAPRNVIVDRTGRVVVLDTLALWNAPLYEDLAKFAVALHASRAQTYSHGLAFGEAQIRRVHAWLLAGYYEREPVPEEQIRMYEVLLLLDKWSFELARLARGAGLRAALRALAVDAWFSRRVTRSAKWFFEVKS